MRVAAPAVIGSGGDNMLLKSIVDRSVPLICAKHMIRDWQAGRRRAAGDLSSTSGQRHRDLDVEASLAHIERSYRAYLDYAGIDRFTGTVAEIGPGDNFGVGLMLLANGADEYHAIDRFRAPRDAEQQRQIYGALAQRHGMAALFDGEPAETTIRNLHYHAGEPAETFFRNAGLRFDAIISIAVLEHLYDPIGALSDMARALKPGGLLVHRIDLRDHGMFSRHHHPLTFLTIPAAVYRRMSRNRGRPNRVLWPSYQAWLDASGLDGTLRVTRLVGEPDDLPPAAMSDLDPAVLVPAKRRAAEIRDRLDARFAALPDEELAISGCLLSARRHASAGA